MVAMEDALAVVVVAVAAILDVVTAVEMPPFGVLHPVNKPFPIPHHHSHKHSLLLLLLQSNDPLLHLWDNHPLSTRTKNHLLILTTMKTSSKTTET